MAASSKPTAIHFSLIFFVVVALICGVMAFMFHSELQEKKAAIATAETAAQNATRAVDGAINEINSLKQVIGHGFETVVTPGDERNTNTVVGAMYADINLAGQGLAQVTMSAAIRKLADELRQVTTQRDQLRADLTTEHNNLLALQREYRSGVDEQLTARNRAEGDLQSRIRTSSEQLDQKDADIEKLKEAYTTLQTELDQEQERTAKLEKTLNQQITNLTKINIQLQDELEAAKQHSFESPDGLVRYVDNVSRLVWITLGEADKLKKRTSFSVYSRSNNGVARGSEDIKGSIEVTRILGPHLAEARILKDDLFDPISPEDPIYTPLWSPGRAESFSFVGKIDLDGDGQDDRELLRELIAAHGATIDNDVDLAGVRTGDGISVSTKFLIVGEIPDLASTDRAEEQKVIRDIITHYKNMLQEAREQGVRVVNLGDFANYIGFQPQRRLFRPGDDRPYTLKAGARSAGVKEAPGTSRLSSGKTADVYSGDSKLRPKTSTGQTSKRFSGSGY